jgi:hypothetical protein
MKTLKAQEKIETLLSAAVGTARHQHGLEAYTVYDKSGTVLKNDSCTEPICIKLNCKNCFFFVLFTLV